MTETPQYQHDCDECLFLGRFTHKPKDATVTDSENFDLYIRAGEGRESKLTEYVARYGSLGHEYSAFPDSLVKLCMECNKEDYGPSVSAHIEAYKRHQARLEA